MMPINPKYLIAAGGGALVGSLVTFVITHKVVARKWQGYANEQIQDLKEHYRIIRGEGEYADPTNLVDISETDYLAANPYAEALADDENQQADLKRVADMIAAQGYEKAMEIVGVVEDTGVSVEAAIDTVVTDDRLSSRVEVRTESLFDKAIPVGPDGEPRDPNYPYIISIDEWAVPEDDYEGYEQVTITYYEGDGVLLNSAEEFVADKEALVGVGTLSKFGYRSQDDDIVYVRNEKLGLLIEVVRIEEGYAESKGLNFAADEEDGFERQRRIQRNARKAQIGD